MEGDMKNKNQNKPKYEPPKATDLSAISATGGGVSPLGECMTGYAPFYTCNQGPEFLGACGGGSTPDTSECGPGGVHLWDSCKPGGAAITGCVSGHGQQ